MVSFSGCCSKRARIYFLESESGSGGVRVDSVGLRGRACGTIDWWLG